MEQSLTSSLITSSPLTLYIKRAEMNQTESMIKNVFNTNRIGIVRKVEFELKTGENGKPYHGATVVFDSLFSNTAVNQFMTELMTNQAVKFTFQQPQQPHQYQQYQQTKYWYVQKVVTGTTTTNTNTNTNTVEETVNISNNNGLSDKEYILELEKRVNSLTTQLLMEQTLREKNERNQMGREYDEMRSHINHLEQQQIIEDQHRTIRALNEDLNKALETSEIYLRELEEQDKNEI